MFDHFPKYHMKILLGYFNAKMGREYIFKLTIGNESLHQDSNDNGAGIINFATSKNLVVISMMFPHQNIHKYAWTSTNGYTHNRRWHLSMLNVRSFWLAECDTDYCLVVAKVRDRLAVSKQAAQKFEGERLNLRKLNELEVRKQYQIKISNRFATLKNFSYSEGLKRAWKNIKENIKISAKDSLGL